MQFSGNFEQIWAQSPPLTKILDPPLGGSHLWKLHRCQYPPSTDEERMGGQLDKPNMKDMTLQYICAMG